MAIALVQGRTALLELLDRQLGMLVSSVEIAVRSNHGSTVVAAETILAGLLNRIHGWQLVNANTKWQNCPGIDLIDEGRGVAVQVTATRTADKVRHTLEEAEQFRGSFERLIILIITNASPTRTMRDCAGAAELWNIPEVYRSAGELEADRLEEITGYLARELGTVTEQVRDLPHLELRPTTSLQATGFVGRETELAEIDRRFAGGDRLVVLSGLGGMGKTELAVRYARSYPGLVHFVRFDTDFTHTLAGMAQGIRPRLPDGELSRDEAALAEKVLSLLAGADENDLLILDNADSKTGVLEDLLCDPVFERISNLKLLLTTRSAWDDAIRVEPMPEEPLFGIFRRHGAKATEQEKKDLIDAVGGHTLTIDLIARTLNGRGWRKVTAGMLLEDLRRHSLPEKKYRDVATHYDQSPGQAQIYQHLSVVFDVSGMSDTDHAVLRCASLLPEGGMDTELFGCSLGEEEQDALGLLLERGWLERKDDLLTIHPIIRLVCLTELKPTDESCGGFLKAMIGQYDETNYQLEPCRQMARLLSNASDTLADARGQWALEAGERWRDVGAYSLAHEYSLRAMERMKAHFSPDAPELAQAYNNVGCTYGDLGDHRKALEFLQKALAIREKVLSPEHPDLAQSYNCVGGTYGELGNHWKALEYQQKALAIQEKVLPPEHPDLALSYNNVGSTYGDRGDHGKALEYQQKALTIREKVLPAEHPDLASSYNNMGGTYGYLGDRRKALEYFQKALAIWEKVLPPEHPGVALSYNNVGGTYSDLGDPRKALEYLQKALTIREKVLPPEHPNLAQSYNNVGSAYGYLGDHRKALEFKQKALTIREKVLPPEHPDLAQSYNNVGYTYGDLGDQRKELEYVLKALTIRKKILPPEHPDLAVSYNNVAWIYHKQGKFTDAARSMRRAADIISRSTLPKTHPDRLNYPKWADQFEKEARMQQDMMMKLQLPFPKK